MIQADDGIDLLVTGTAASWFDLAVSAGAAVGGTIKAVAEIITAAGTISAPGLGAGE